MKGLEWALRRREASIQAAVDESGRVGYTAEGPPPAG